MLNDWNNWWGWLISHLLSSLKYSLNWRYGYLRMAILRDFVWCYNSVILPNYAKDDCEIIQFLLKTIWTRTRYEAKKCGKKQGESQSVYWHILHSSSCPIHVQFMSTCFRLCLNWHYFYAKSKSEDFSEKIEDEDGWWSNGNLNEHNQWCVRPDTWVRTQSLAGV